MNTKNPLSSLARISPASSDELTAQRILEAIHSLKYGSVEVTVHDGRVVQIDRKERIRVQQPTAKES
ncbi:MAG: YezD family protein [Candidatus Hydrogenedentes bacterium]|nr:YezD family protein [Candidatus Hydrogenedentota bacterium]